jgi:predicted NBD/HSP70 family sugar kinase
LLRAAGRSTDATQNLPQAAEAVLLAARADEPSALQAVRHVSARLGSGLATLVNLTDPDRIVLGGRLADYHRLAPGPLTENLAARSFISHAEAIPIAAGALPDAALLGAADLAFQPLLNDPRSAP